MRNAIAALLLAVAGLAHAAPIPPSSCTNCILNTASPQEAQINIGTATIRGTLNVSTLNVTNLVITNLSATNITGSGAGITALNASQLTSGTVPFARLSGSYTGITGVGTLAAGVWNGTAIGTQYGGTGQNFVTQATGTLVYFSNVGVMAGLPAAAAGRILQTNGATAAPSWTAAPQVLGTNITGIPLANLQTGNLPAAIKATDASLVSVTGAKVIGDINGNAEGITGTLSLNQLEPGTLGVNIIAQKLNATGVSSGTFGGPGFIPQIQVSTDGRIYAVSQSTLSVPPVIITPGSLPSGVLIDPTAIQAGFLGFNVVASSLNSTGAIPGTYGGPAMTLTAVLRGDGRLNSITQELIALPADQLTAGLIPSGVVVPPENIDDGLLNVGVVAQTVATTTVVAGTYGGPTQVPFFTVGGDGRLTAAGQNTIPSLSTTAAVTNLDNAWSHAQTSFSSWTILGDFGITGTLGVTGPVFASTYTGQAASLQVLDLFLTTAPPPVAGRIYFNATTGKLNVSPDGISFVALSTATGGGGSSGPCVSSGTGNVLCGFGINFVIGSSNTVSGGEGNSNLNGAYSFIGGGQNNSLANTSASHNVITGGVLNTITSGAGNQNTIGGGNSNSITSSDISVIAGGASNTIGAPRGTIGGGQSNTVSGQYGVVSGGRSNANSNESGTIAGGRDNAITLGSFGAGSVISGGNNNTISNVANTQGVVIAGGSSNLGGGAFATISGGNQNDVPGAYATVPGGLLNRASGDYSFAAGRRAKATAQGSFALSDSQDANLTVSTTDQLVLRFAGGSILGGNSNSLGNSGLSVIGGGTGNTVADSNNQMVIAGGLNNTIAGGDGFIGGGFNNSLSAFRAVLVGGRQGSQTGNYGFLGGGRENTTDNEYGFVGGGRSNNISLGAFGAGSVIVGGESNSISNRGNTQGVVIGGGSDNVARGAFSVVPGGRFNRADGDFAFAMGRRAKTSADGVFVISDSQDADLLASTTDQFRARFQGGFYFESSSFTFINPLNPLPGLYIDQTGQVGVGTTTFFGSEAMRVNGELVASTFNAIGSAYQMNGVTFLGSDLELRVNGVSALDGSPLSGVGAVNLASGDPGTGGSGNTTTAGPIQLAGATQLRVASHANFTAGDRIFIDDGVNTEVNVVVATRTMVNDYLDLRFPTAFVHNSGIPVQEIVARTPVIVEVSSPTVGDVLTATGNNTAVWSPPAPGAPHLYQAGGFSHTLGAGTTFFAFIPDENITLIRITVTVVVAGVGGAGDTYRCQDGSGNFIDVTVAAAAPAGTVTSNTSGAPIASADTVNGLLFDSAASPTPVVNVICEYTTP